MLISDEYRAEQAHLHESRADYGVASIQYAPAVSALVNRLEIKSMVDYGCGKGRLLDGLQLQRSVAIQMYDPAIERYAGLPEPAELVVCIDVLEHIEPDLLMGVLDHIKDLARNYVFLTIHTGPAVKVLRDGRNAHLTQQPAAWWLPLLMDRWEMLETKKIGPGFIFVGRPYAGR
jgi:2-polyprenyl-3-methyl-5-hydroxy-6-metoxy-1,4-benzoquinol methylase